MACALQRRGAERTSGWLLACCLSASWLAASCAPALPPAGLPLGEPTPGSATELDRPARAWVERTLRGLSVREKAAQLITLSVPATPAGAGAASEETLGQLVDAGVGGLLISAEPSAATAARLNALQARASLPLLVASELEPGEPVRPDTRLAGPGAPLAQLASADTLPDHLARLFLLPAPPEAAAAVPLPSALALGAIGEEGFAREAGRIAGARARAAGVHVAFAPTLHVNGASDSGLDPRSFGEEPAQVARLAVAFLGGLQESGLLSAARPDPSDRRTFERAVRAGVDAALAAPELGRELAFPGLVYADARPGGAEAFGRSAATAAYASSGPDALRPATPDPGEAAVRALERGADVLLTSADPEAAIEALSEAVRAGRLSEERLDASVRRLLEAKARAGLHRGRRVEADAVARVVGAPTHVDFVTEAARRSLVVPRDVEARIPLDPYRLEDVLSVTYAASDDRTAGRALDAALAAAGLEIRAARAEPGMAAPAWDALAAAAKETELVLVSLYASHPADESEREAAEPLARFLERLRAEDVPALLLSFGSPHLLRRLPETAGTLIAWGGGELWQRAAADALLGRGLVAGRLPVSLPPFHRRGDGLSRPLGRLPVTTPGAESPAEEAGMSEEALARVDRILQAAVADSIAPGMALAVGRAGKLVRLRGYGRVDWSPGAARVTDSTLYDLASITKAVGTATAVLLLAEEGRLSLDDRVFRWLPEWREGPLEAVTVRDLLLHRSGLPPSLAFWREHRGRAAYRRVLARVPLLHEPGERTLYSDLGYLALGFVAEEASGRPLDALLHERLFLPLGLGDTGFRPPPELKPRIAPTEVDTIYRGTHVHGEVHDENAHAVGGVAGHAGLFSSARDLAAFASMLLQGGARPVAAPAFEAAARPGAASEATVGPGARWLLTEETLRLLSEPPEAPGSRTHGWEAAAAGSSAGHHLSYRAFGHTGFTGTSLWIDPELDLFIVLLTNRVNPTRHRDGMAALRRAVHEAVVRAIQDEASS